MDINSLHRWIRTIRLGLLGQGGFLEEAMLELRSGQAGDGSEAGGGVCVACLLCICTHGWRSASLRSKEMSEHKVCAAASASKVLRQLLFLCL